MERERTQCIRRAVDVADPFCPTQHPPRLIQPGRDLVGNLLLPVVVWVRSRGRLLGQKEDCCENHRGTRGLKVWSPPSGLVHNLNITRRFSTTVRGNGEHRERLWRYGGAILQPGVYQSMADTYLSLRVHLVWATKNRRPWLDPEWRSRLFACVAAVVARHGGELLCAGGIRDHIHLYVEPPSNLALSDLVASIKATTCKWIHESF